MTKFDEVTGRAKVLEKWINRAEKAEARIVELEKDLSDVASQAAEFTSLANRFEADNARRTADLAAMREALEFYAVKGSWQWDISPSPAGDPIPGSAPAECDHGSIARQALAALPSAIPDSGEGE